MDVARGEARAELGPDVPARMEPSRDVVAAAIAGDDAGLRRQHRLRRARRHPGGRAGPGAGCRARSSARTRPRPGRRWTTPTVRAMLLLRARTLAAGYSGVRADLPRRLLELLDLGLLPVIPGKGSVGASGDLAQLAHLAQPLIGEGRLRGAGRPGRRAGPAAEVLAEHGLEPARAGAQGGPVAGQRHRADAGPARVLGARRRAAGPGRRRRLRAVGRGAAGTDRPYDERVQALRPHPGQLDSAANLRALLAGSALLASHRHSRHAVQDAYCLRCAPQVHGAVRDVLGLRPAGHRHRARRGRRQPGDRGPTARS